MDLGYYTFSVCVMVICLLGAARHSNCNKNNCPCPEVPLRNLTENPPSTCFQTNARFRYTCITNYVRKSGTSDLIKCRENNGFAQWTVPTLKCIRDPKIQPTPTPEEVKKTVTYIPLDSITSTTVTAPTSIKMTQSISSSASVTAETHIAELTPPRLQVPSDHSHDSERETEAANWTSSTSTTAQPSNGGSHASTEFSSLSTTVSSIAIVSLVAICAVIGIGLWRYKRTKANIAQPTEEEIPMNDTPSNRASPL